MKRIFIAVALILGVSAVSSQAQNPNAQGFPPGPGAGGQRPPPPIIAVLDVNRDGVIDAAEIANAPVALRRLDKNGDGRLTPDEFWPPIPQDGGFAPAPISPNQPRAR
ncbi:MAG: EF-hand domain-containing protein [Verrucomicrobiae bacterium]|nr:EF-hand domain-containing protein [Verrucomicrobiae bacterium]